MASAMRTKMARNAKGTLMVLEAVIAVLSALVFFPLSKNTQLFSQNCLLNANIRLSSYSNKSVGLDLTKTVFGEVYECNFTTFVNVVIALHSLIWIWFFYHLDVLRTKKGSAVNLLIPAILTHFAFFIAAIISGGKIQSGFNSWCHSIEENKINPAIKMTCKDYEKLSWTVNRSNFYTYCQMASISAWLLVVALLVSMVMAVVHLYWDFEDTTYIEVEEEEEEREKPASGLLETSGFADNGVGVVNKGAVNYEDFLNDVTEDDTDDSAGPGDVEVVVHRPRTTSDAESTSLRNRGSYPEVQ